MKIILLCMMAMSFSVAAICQTKNVEMFGKIMDQHMKPIPDVTIVLKGTKFQTKTDSTGYYKFMLPAQAGTLIYTHANYITREEKFTGTPQATDLLLAAKKDK